ncbi:MAG TPA: TIGR03619 family F420-dependent LLM class oxidoreductase [Stellaceae bacterium]|jgi:probable F420-dependent oxidoreductase|nr:TIGR03619 family F420-dependent LLM class oxidoreductase [Stellaceae bacterium]
MRFGLMQPSYSFADLDYAKAARLRRFCREAETRGYEAIWVPEHLLTARGLYGTAWLSPLEMLSFAAGATEHIRLATGILIPPIRNPVFLAKEIASLHMLSGGRFELGVGVGWDAQEFGVAGVPLGQRGGRTDEILDIFDRLWSGDEVSHHGRYYRFDRVTIDPPLPTRPRLWVAGGSKIKTAMSPDPETIAPSVLERICRRADGWLARAAGSNESVIADWRQITRRLDEIGRPRSAVIFAHLNFAHIVPTDDEAAALRVQRPLIERIMGTHRSFEHLQTCYLLGSARRMRERIAELAQAGLEYLVLSPLDYDLEQLDLWEAEILRHFRAA